MALILGIALGFQLCTYAISIAIDKLVDIENSGIEFNPKNNTITLSIDKLNKENLSQILITKNKI